MTLAVALTLGAIIGLLALSGLFSGSETALTATSRARMHQLEKHGDHRAMRVNRLIGAPERLIGSLLLGNNLVNILASALATQLLLDLFGDVGVAYATLIMTALVLIFSEVLPKTISLSNPDSSALKVSAFAAVVVLILSPVAKIVQFVVRTILQAFGYVQDKDSDILSAHDELRGAIAMHHRDGAVVKHDRDMLGGILDLKELEISDVMVHRTNMVSVCVDDPVQDIISSVLSSTFTRLPLWSGSPENIVGVLHAKDLAQALVRTKGKVDKIDVKSLASQPWYVPDSTPLQSQLNAFLREKIHLAFVVDEYGEVMGLLTLEDI
ncbi:MAG: CNNM domain-containing protein, partial [Fimbriimonadaceae bacterium]|nr:CNNM domain-containing protein [Alphaproteobacteria bacterium]